MQELLHRVTADVMQACDEATTVLTSDQPGADVFLRSVLVRSTTLVVLATTT